MNTQTLTRSAVKALAERTPERGVSILMPTHPKGAEARQDPLRYRNLLDAAEEQLGELGVHEPAGQLAPLRPAQEDFRAWEENGAPGLAIFADVGADRPDPEWYALASAPEALGIVDGCYHVTPLLSAINRNRTFYLLALGQNGVQFYRADREAMEPLTLPGAPEDFAEIMGQYVQDEQIQYHTGTPNRHGGGERRAMVHGQGVASDETDQKKKLAEYCQRIAEAVRGRAAETHAPILLAATEPLAGLYREASRTGLLYPETLRGNPEHTPAEDLHAEAVERLEDYFAGDVRRSIDAFGTASGQEQTATDLEAVLKAAHIGQVDRLFIREAAHRWGHYDAERFTVRAADGPAAGATDLLNLAAVATLRAGGEVFLVTAEEMSAAEPVAAILRYRLEAD
jgi:hypothetical protein